MTNDGTMVTLSRVADTLYWLSRYLERAEHTARLLDLQLHLMLDQTQATVEPRFRRLLDALYINPPESLSVNAYAIANLLTFDMSNDNTIVSCIAAARENARHVREQISSEMWEQVNRLYFQVRSSNIDKIWHDQPHLFYQAVKDGCHLFQGITDGTMNNGEGWQFIQVGRYLERACSIARLLSVHYRDFYVDGGMQARDFMEWTGLLKSCTAFEAYCKVYTADLRPDRIAEFLILNAEFPHSIRFSVKEMFSALQSIASATGSKHAGRVNRLVGRLRATVDYSQVDEILASGLHRYLENIQDQCSMIHDAIYQAYILYPADEFA